MISEHYLVLIGEDEPDNQVILQTVVESLVGVRAEVAGDGLAVLDHPKIFGAALRDVPVGGQWTRLSSREATSPMNSSASVVVQSRGSN